MKNDRSFSIRRLHLWMLVASLFAAIQTSHPCTVLSATGGTFVAVMLVCIDAITPQKRRCLGALACSFFACGLAFAVATSFTLLLLFPPKSPPTPGIDYFMAISKAINDAISTAIAYLLTFSGLTALSFGTAIYSWRTRTAAKWLVLVNTPGMLLIVYVTLVIAMAAWAGDLRISPAPHRV